MTDETPEQQLRTAVMAAWPNIAKWDAALDLYGRERYLAGKVEMARRAPWALSVAEAEAEYAACVAEIRKTDG